MRTPWYSPPSARSSQRENWPSLGQHFADLEHQQFGTNEFATMVERVASIEQNLGIYDLTQFTPQVTQYTPPA